MDTRLFEQNVTSFPDGVAGWVAMAGDGATGAVLTRQRGAHGWLLALLVHPDRQGGGLGSALLAAAESELAAGGAARIEPGSSPGHFLPGVPEGPAVSFFARHGYRPLGEVVDLVQDLAGFVPPPEGEEALARTNAVIRPCPEDRTEALFAFLAEEFPGRWLEETRRRLGRDRSEEVLVLELEGQVAGFCHVFHAGSRVLGPSVYWRKALGPAFGGLGPIGLGTATRGKGLGLALTCRAVERARALGVQRMAVDWTDLVPFYARCGFEVWRRYRRMERSLEDLSSL